MPDTTLEALSKSSPDALRNAHRVLRLYKALNQSTADAKKEAEKYAQRVAAARAQGGDEYAKLYIKTYADRLDKLEAMTDAGSYKEARERLAKQRDGVVDDMRKAVDPLRIGEGVVQAMAAIESGGQAAFIELLNSKIDDPLDFTARLGVSTDGFPEALFLGAGLGEEDAKNMSVGLFDPAEYDEMYDAWDDPEKFNELAEDATENEFERTWPRVEQMLQGADASVRKRAAALYRQALLRRAQGLAHAESLRTDLEEMDATLGDLDTAAERGVPLESLIGRALAEADMIVAPLEGNLMPTKEQATTERQRPFSETNPEAMRQLEETYGLQTAQQLGGMDQEAAMRAMSMLDMQRSNLNPMTSALLDYMDRVQKAPTDPAFVQWRSARGIPSNQPVTVGEYNRYQRQARKVGRGTFKAKKTGAIRSIEYADKSFAFDGGPMGALYFTNDKDEYLTPEQVQERAEADLAGANVVEFALSGNDEVLTRVGNAIVGAGGEDVGEFLQKLAGTPASDRVRMRVLFDKKTGDIVVLDKDRKVEFPGRVGEGSEDLAMLYRLSEDPEMADVAGSGSDLAKAKPGNAVQTLAGVKKGSKFDSGPYIPKDTVLQTEPPKTTVVGEVVNIPGADPRYAYVMQEVGGEKRTVKVPLADVLDHHDFKDVSEFAAAVGVDSEDRAVQRMWGRAERKKGRSKRIKERASKRAPLGAKSTAAADSFGDLPELAAREEPKKSGEKKPEEKKASTPESQALGGDVANPRIAPVDETPDYGAALDQTRLGTSEQDMSIESPVSPDEPSAVGQWRYTQLPHFGGRPEDNRLYPQASLAERLSEAWEGNFGDKKDDKKKPKK